MDPNWRHIIPPFQEKVVSEGHCVEDCTRKSFPRQGISIFAVMMRTHLIGKEIKLRHIRNDEEFPPIAFDKNIDPNYQEYRRLPSSVRTMPGDRLISECTYDSSNRDQITLGMCGYLFNLVIRSLIYNNHFRWNNNKRRKLHRPDVLLSTAKEVDYLPFVT